MSGLNLLPSAFKKKKKKKKKNNNNNNNSSNNNNKQTKNTFLDSNKDKQNTSTNN